jgi:AcrR family transcriptional regulator
MPRPPTRSPDPAVARSRRRGEARGNGEKRTQRERKDRSQHDLLEAALELVAERGYRGASLAAIGERAGYSRGLVTEHFGSKEGLLRELVSRLMTGWRSLVLSDDVGDKRGAQALSAVVLAHRRAIKERPSAMRALYVLLFESVLELSSMRDEFKKMDSELRKLAAAYLVEGQKSGTIRADIDAEAQAALMLAAVRGITLQWMVDPDAFDLDRVYTELARWTEEGLSAVKVTKPRPARKKRPRGG